MERIRNDQLNYYNLLKKGAWQVIFVRLLSLGIVYEIFISLALPLTIKIMAEYITARINALELQRENMRLEFNFLKSQVNPHFLFNTLNNIYALILKDRKDDSAETVTRLSTFLRYSLYETDADLNPAGKEIELLRSYVALEKIRLNETVVNFSVVSDDENYLLPPLLFVPAVENAFKFCTPSSAGDAYIFISLSIKNYLLEFVISNTFNHSLHQSKTTGGIGLSNLRRRLATQYPGDRHSILTSAESNIFSLTIVIKLAA
jgi:LytS/YehU family sensor histidine kinase